MTLPLVWLHLTPDRPTHFHELLPMNSVYQGLLIDFVAVLAICRVVFWLLERWDPRGDTIAWAIVTAVLLERLYRGVVLAVWDSPGTKLGSWIFLGVAGAGLLLWALRRSGYGAAVRGVRWTLVLLGFSIFWVLPELVVMAFHAEPHEAASFTRPVEAQPQRRIVWMLFDEASFDQIFDHRQPGVALPHFDALARTSVNFSDVQPAGYFTEKVIPSLLQGEIITQEESDLEGRLYVKTREHRSWRLYPDEQSLFAEAQREGWSTGVVGWFNPYCRMFARELDDCSWTLTTSLPGGYAPRQSAWQNAAAPLGRGFLRSIGLQPAPRISPSQMHAEDYQATLARAQAEIAGDRIGFLFIHLPVPHPGGMYDRKTGRIGVKGSYLDNLVLADETLGALLDGIQRSGLGSQTTVIVSSDHSWRVAMWRPTADWDTEDTRASGGRFDPRPVLMVQFPGEDRGVTMNRAFPLIAMHGMVEQMLAGRMGDGQALEAWAAQR